MSNDNYVVIGGTSGIGRAIAALLLDRGHNLYVGSRSAAAGDFESGVTAFESIKYASFHIRAETKEFCNIVDA